MVEEELGIGIVKLLHSGHTGYSILSKGPDAMEKGGLYGLLESMGCYVAESKTAELTADEALQYGARHLLGLASRHLAEIVSHQLKRGLFPIGLLANCNGLMGMLAGVQRSGTNYRPLRAGLVWIDAHGDMNTPETSLSGMLGGIILL